MEVNKVSTEFTTNPTTGQIKGAKTLGFVRRHPVVAYYILTLALSWVIEFPLIVQVQGWFNLQLPLALHYLASFGPLLAAVIVTWMLGGAGGLQELWSRMVRWRMGRFRSFGTD